MDAQIYDRLCERLRKARVCSVNIAVLEQERVQLGKFLEAAKALMGLLESDQALKELDPVLAIQLLERIQKWMELGWLTQRSTLSKTS